MKNFTSLSPLGKLKWEGDFLQLATLLSKEITSHTRAVALLYCQSTGQVLQKRSQTFVTMHMVDPTGTRDPGICALISHWLPHSTSSPPNSAFMVLWEWEECLKNPMLTSEKIFHV